jgi:hypothetical protein
MPMNTESPLDLLESDVLARIRRHRLAQSSIRPIPIAIAVCVSALAGGLLTGMAERHRDDPAGSEAALLADDLSLAPSSLLANSQ